MIEKIKILCYYYILVLFVRREIVEHVYVLSECERDVG